MLEIIIRCKNVLFCSQRDKYKLQLDRALHKIEYLRSNARMAESQCRELDSAVTNVRRECSELRKIEAKYCATACNFLVSIIVAPSSFFLSRLRKEVPKTAGGV